MSTKQRGGRRRGAGRPITAPMRVLFRLDQETVDALQRIADRLGVTRSEALRMTIKRRDNWVRKMEGST